MAANNLVVGFVFVGILIVWLLRSTASCSGYRRFLWVTLCYGAVLLHFTGVDPPTATPPSEVFHAYSVFDGPFDILARLAHRLGLTANFITWSCLFAVLLAGRALFYGRPLVGLAWWFYYYAADDVDGRVARRYKQVSDFGGALDQFVDHMARLSLCMAVLCSPQSLSGRRIPAFACACCSFSLAIVMMACYDDAVRFACGEEGLDAGSTLLHALSFCSPDLTRYEATSLARLLSKGGTEFCQCVVFPLVTLFNFHTDLQWQIALLVLLSSYYGYMWWLAQGIAIK